MPEHFPAHIHTKIKYHMGFMASNAFIEEAQNDLVQNLENIQMDVFLSH